MSSYSSTTSSINPLKENGGPKENGGFIKSRHSRIGVKTATSPEKYNAHSEVNTNRIFFRFLIMGWGGGIKH